MKHIKRKLKIGMCSGSSSGLSSDSDSDSTSKISIPIPIPHDIMEFMIDKKKVQLETIKDLGEVVLGGKYLVTRELKNVLNEEGYLGQVMDKTKGPLPVDVVQYVKRTQTPKLDCYVLEMELKHQSDDTYSLLYLSGNGRSSFGYGKNKPARTANFWSFSDGNDKFCFAIYYKDEETTPEGS